MRFSLFLNLCATLQKFFCGFFSTWNLFSRYLWYRFQYFFLCFFNIFYYGFKSTFFVVFLVIYLSYFSIYHYCVVYYNYVTLKYSKNGLNKNDFYRLVNDKVAR